MKIGIYICFIITSISFSNTAQAQMTNKITYLALGDSYTIGESVTESERWPVQLTKELNEGGIEVEKPKIIATTGWRTDNLMNGINIAQLKETFGLVSLLIGVNNQYQHKPIELYIKEFEDLLKRAVELADGKKGNVFVVSIPDYGYTPFGKPKQQEISKELDEYNEINKRITAGYGIQYVNITDISRRGFDDPELVASDGLHPSGKQYKLWVERILKEVDFGAKSFR